MKKERIALFVVGEPAVGKTELVRRMIGKAAKMTKGQKWTIGEVWAAAGHYSGRTFDGADTVPYNGVKDYLEFWKRFIQQDTIFDGDRFSNLDALESLQKSGIPCRCVLVEAPPELITQRRILRGSHQNEQWMKGRKTKAARFFDLFDEKDSLRICNDKTPERAIMQINDFLSRLS